MKIFLVKISYFCQFFGLFDIYMTRYKKTNDVNIKQMMSAVS